MFGPERWWTMLEKSEVSGNMLETLCAMNHVSTHAEGIRRLRSHDAKESNRQRRTTYQQIDTGNHDSRECSLVLGSESSGQNQFLSHEHLWSCLMAAAPAPEGHEGGRRAQASASALKQVGKHCKKLKVPSNGRGCDHHLCAQRVAHPSFGF